MSQAPTVILFDFDFTLADPGRARSACLNAGLAALGAAPPPDQALQATVGLSLDEVLARFVTGAGAAEQEAFRSAFVAEADKVMVDGTALYEGVPELLATLHGRGLRLGIVSLKDRAHIVPVLVRENVIGFFAVVVGGDEVQKAKPDPEGLLVALRHMRAEAAEALYVGDSPGDALAASRAGIRFVAVAPEAGKTRLQTVPHPISLTHVRELPRILDALGAA
jgi:phosphoglycolate phosphatase